MKNGSGADEYYVAGFGLLEPNTRVLLVGQISGAYSSLVRQELGCLKNQNLLLIVLTWGQLEALKSLYSKCNALARVFVHHATLLHTKL